MSEQQGIYAESKAQSARGDQNRVSEREAYPDSETGARGASGSPSDFGSRAAGENREGADLVSILAGGIITQLIKQAEDQLGETIACIDWYEAQRKKVEQKLLELHKLKNLAMSRESAEVGDRE